MHNILTDPVITCRNRQGRRRRATLPGVLQLAATGELDSFTRLRAHQEHSWHSFLAQLAAIALHEAGYDQPPQTEHDWREILRGLTPDWPADQPWHLTVTDPTEPALLQPPSSSREIFEKDYSRSDQTPDAIDLLVASKNHMVKQAMAWHAAPEDWIYALVSLQTMQGYSGGSRHGISRMNKGHSNRPCVSLAPEGGHPGAHLQRDILALPQARQAIMEAHPYYQEGGGIALVWLLPWDGEKSEYVSPRRLDPLYIEVCRRIRLNLASGGRMEARRATSRGTRIDPELDKNEVLGRTGDPWTPTSVTREGIPLTVARTDSEPGLSYSRITDLLNEARWQPAPLMHPTAQELEDNTPLFLVARALIRGQGETQGYHQRVIPLPSSPPSPEDEGAGPAQRLGRVAASRLQQVSDAQRIMSHAVHSFAGSGGREQQRWTRHATDNVSRDLDNSFLEDAAAEADAPAEKRAELRVRWVQERLQPLCQAELDRATDQLPCPAARRLKARVSANRLFENRMRRLVMLLMPQHEEQPAGQPEDQEETMNANPGTNIGESKPEATAKEATANDATTNEAMAQDDEDQSEMRSATEVYGGANPRPANRGSGTPAAEEPPATDGEEANSNRSADPLGDAVVRISQQLASPRFPRGDVGALRRMNTEGPYPPVLYQILVRNRILDEAPAGSEREKNWAAIIRGIAVMTPRNLKEPPPGGHLESAHNPTRSMGREMHGDDERPRISEQRLNRLMDSRGQPLRQLLSHLTHALKDHPFNWRDASRLLLSEDEGPEARQAARERIVRSYCVTAEIVAARHRREQADAG